MEREKISTFAAKFKKAFSEGVLNELGKATRYCHRVRQLTPYRMVMGVALILRPQCTVRLGNSTTFSGISTVRW
jgi:hypothetical protein